MEQINRSMEGIETFFVNMLADRLAHPEEVWFTESVTALQKNFDRTVFLKTFSSASRYLGASPLDLSPFEGTRLKALGLAWPLSRWALDDLGRAILLLFASEWLSENGFLSLVFECYDDGDLRGKQSVIRTLPLVPSPERFLEIGITACRGPVQLLFEAIVCENPYPALYFPPIPFNRMILKALISQAPLGQIVGLKGRMSPELIQTALVYVSDQKGADRPVHPDIHLLLPENSIFSEADTHERVLP